MAVRDHLALYMLSIILSALAFIVLLSVLIMIHEWGHFAAARKAGVVVEEFGFGLPPKAKTVFRQGGTDFTLNWIPFGGFVRLKGENALEDKERTAKGSFGAASIPARLVILSAGVFMNLILALCILTFGFSYGQWIPTYVSIAEYHDAVKNGDLFVEKQMVIEEVQPGSPADAAGVIPGSLLVAIDGATVYFTPELRLIQAEKDQVTYTLQSPTEDGTVDVVVKLQDGLSGILLTSSVLSVPRRPLGEGFVLSLRESWVVTEQTVLGIGSLFSSLAQSGRVPEGITGLVGIAQYTHDSVKQGITAYLRLVALLSLSLAALNILPFPALDGGRIMFVLAELCARRPMNRRFELTVNAIGFFLLLGLIFLITFNDIVKLF